MPAAPCSVFLPKAAPDHIYEKWAWPSTPLGDHFHPVDPNRTPPRVTPSIPLIAVRVWVGGRLLDLAVAAAVCTILRHHSSTASRKKRRKGQPTAQGPKGGTRRSSRASLAAAPGPAWQRQQGQPGSSRASLAAAAVCLEQLRVLQGVLCRLEPGGAMGPVPGVYHGQRAPEAVLPGAEVCRHHPTLTDWSGSEHYLCLYCSSPLLPLRCAGNGPSCPLPLAIS